MKKQNAMKLYNGDQVQVKGTGEYATVISTESDNNNTYVYAMTNEGYTKLNHKEIR